MIDFPGSSASPRHRGHVFALVVICLAMFLPGFSSLPPMDRDEPRFAQASKQMLETGDYVDIRFQGEARNKKPVGIYWLQATAVNIGEALGLSDARRQIWLYRIPSLLGAIAAVLGTYWTALALTTAPQAFIAALLLASTILLNVEARLAKTDAVLLATVVFSMGALARVYLAREGSRWRTPAVFWTAMAVGILIKGPITPMVAAFASVVLAAKERSGRWLGALRPGLGLLWVLLLALPWFVLILVRTHGHFLADSVGHDMLGKVAGAQESHGAPPGSYLAAFWVSAWPMAPFVALAIPGAWRRRREPAIVFLLAWLVPTWLLFEMVPTKLPHYVLPTYPALAIAATIILGGEAASRVQTVRPVVKILIGALFLLLPVTLAIGLFAGRGFLWEGLPTTTLVTGLLVAVVLAAVLLWAGRRLLRRDLNMAVTGTLVSAVLTYGFIIGHLLTPSIADRLALSGRLADAARSALGPACPDGGIASVGSHEPSLVFLTRTDLDLTDAAGAAAFLKGGDCRAALVDFRSESAFKTALGDEPATHLAGRITGTAINGAKPLDIGIYVRQRQTP